jgi:GDP-mannose 6-dehydrogenase
MKLIVWGLGRCGLVNAACFARAGNEIIGVDCDRDRVERLDGGHCDCNEPDLVNILGQTTDRVTFRPAATDDVIAQADMSLICVGTPARKDKCLDTSQVESALTSITDSLARSSSAFHSVIIRSTTPIGFLRNRAAAIMERRARSLPGKTYGLATLPEFLREGSAVRDFGAPAYLLAGCLDEGSRMQIDKLYRPLNMQPSFVEPEEAEALKLVSNAFHALKVSFANEVGLACAFLNVSPQRVMRLMCEDNQLNIAPAYLRPGAPFGGGCLGKDTESFLAQARACGIELPMLDAVLASNGAYVARCVDTIRDSGASPVGLLGLAFKPGVDDLRQSPALEIARRLKAEGKEVLAYDEALSNGVRDRRTRQLLEHAFGDYRAILCSSAEEVVRRSKLTAIMHPGMASAELRALAARSGGDIADFTDANFSWASVRPGRNAQPAVRNGGRDRD